MTSVLENLRVLTPFFVNLWKDMERLQLSHTTTRAEETDDRQTASDKVRPGHDLAKLLHTWDKKPGRTG